MIAGVLAAEQQILATCLTSYTAIREVSGILRDPATFTTTLNQQVYSAMLSLNKQNVVTDVVLVHNALLDAHGDLNGDPSGWITFLTGLIPEGEQLTGNLAKLCYWLMEQSMGRDLQKTLSAALIDLKTPGTDSFGVMAAVRSQFALIESQINALSEKPFSADLALAVELAQKAALTGDPITGVKTLIHEFDLFVKGLHGSTSTIIAARPAMGKTAMLCQMAYNIAYIQQKPVAIFSLEMKKLQLARRFLSINTGYKNSTILSGTQFGDPIDFDALYRSAGKVGGCPLFVYDSKTIRSLDHIVAKVNQLTRDYPGIVVFIDYLQLVKTADRDLRVRVTNVSETIKDLANYNDIPIVSLAQLSREVEKRPDKRPQLSDLKESGSIEQDADNVTFLYRPGYYSATDPVSGEPVDMNLLYHIVAKNRNGSTHNDNEAISLHYDMSTNRIGNYDKPTF